MQFAVLRNLSVPVPEVENSSPRSDILRSGMLTVLVLASFLLLLGIGCRSRRVLSVSTHVAAPHLLIGGREPIVLDRPQSDGGLVPEFISATLLPGRGMNLLQLMAYLPGTGVVPLLDSPSPDQINPMLADAAADRNGAVTAGFGGAFLLPLDSRTTGTLSADGQSLTLPWHGHTLTLPVDAPGTPPIASNGLFNAQAASSVEVDALPDGEMATAVYEPGDFDGSWPSTTRVTVVVTLTRKDVDLTVTAVNTGSAPEPMAIGWRPSFVIPSGHRAEMLLHLPPAGRIQTGADGLPTGHILPVTGTPYDFTAHDGSILGSQALNDSFEGIHTSSLIDNDPAAELRDRSAQYGLRILPLSSNIKIFHVTAPAAKPALSIEPRMSLDDPFSKQWQEDSGVVTLAPGDSVEWKVRLELFLPTQASLIP
jgi:aldose 1-epimerase